MHGTKADLMVADEATAAGDHTARTYARYRYPLRLYLTRHHDGTWVMLYQRLTQNRSTLHNMRRLFVTSEKRVDLGRMRTKEAMKVLDGAWRMFKLEHARETT